MCFDCLYSDFILLAMNSFLGRENFSKRIDCTLIIGLNLTLKNDQFCIIIAEVIEELFEFHQSTVLSEKSYTLLFGHTDAFENNYIVKYQQRN